MLCLTYNAGLRVSELVGLALENLKMPTLDEVHIIGKGRRERVLPLWKETRGALRDWLAIRPKSADRHLFLNPMGTGMTRRGFAKRLVLHAQTAAHSVPSITAKIVSPHLLRHACAIHTLEASRLKLTLRTSGSARYSGSSMTVTSDRYSPVRMKYSVMAASSLCGTPLRRR